MKKRVNRTTARPERSRGVALHVAPILVLLAIGIIAYWNSFDVPFVFDDVFAIQMNPVVQSGSALLPAQLLARSVLYFTFAANYAIGGDSVWGYHLVNLLLHLLNGILIYFLATRIFNRTLGQKEGAASFALLAAAFFLVHPVQTESVTYISSRSELLSTLFYLLAVLLFAYRSPERIGFAFSLLIGIFFLLGIGTKETVISLPAALLLYDFIFFSNAQVRAVLSRWRFYLTFILGAMAVAFYLLAFKLQSSVGGAAPGNLSSYHYFLTQLRVIVRYVQVLFIPAGLNLAYDFRPSTSLFDIRVILSAVFLLALVCLGWWLRRRNPVVAFSLLWFFVTLAPTSSFVPVLDVIYDHRLYLPMIGVCLSFPLLIDFIREFVRSKLGWRLPAAAFGATVVIAFVVGTVMRNEVWRDEVRLWSDVIAKSPGKARGYSGLAQAYYSRGQYQQAIEVSMRGLQNVSQNALGFHGNIGQFYLRLGRYDEALDTFSEAISLTATPVDQARAYQNLAVTYIYKSALLKPDDSEEKDRLLSKAEEALQKSIEADPAYLPAWDSYINVAVDRGKQETLRVQLEERLLKAKTQDPMIDYGFGKLAFQQGDYQEAAKYFRQAAGGFKGDKMFCFNYAYALEEIGSKQEATNQYLEALKSDPQFLQAHYNLAQLYMENGGNESAIQHFNEVVRLDPRNTLAHLQLARIYIRQGQRALARNHLTAVLSVSPGDQEATALWQQTL